MRSSVAKSTSVKCSAAPTRLHAASSETASRHRVAFSELASGTRQRARARRVGSLGERAARAGAPQRTGERSEHGPRGSPVVRAPMIAVAAGTHFTAKQ
jgi:hypothetical protein